MRATMPRTRRSQQFTSFGTPDQGGYTRSTQRVTSGSAMPNYGTQQQQGGFPAVPQQGQRSAPDMSAYGGARNSGGNFRSMPGGGYGPPAGGAPPAMTVDGNPVAPVDPSGIQRQIDDLKRRGTWDNPQNARARERLEKELADAQSAPPGYFVAPDGSLQPNFVYEMQRGGGPAARSGPTMLPAPEPEMPEDVRYALGRLREQERQRLTQAIFDGTARYGPAVDYDENGEMKGEYFPPPGVMPSTPAPSPPVMAVSRAMPTPTRAPLTPEALRSGTMTASFASPEAHRQFMAPQTPYPTAQTMVAPTQQYVFPNLVNTGDYFNPDFRQRDAFINNITTTLGQQQLANMGGSAPVAPMLNIPALWSQAGQMVQDGWTNPLAGLFG